MVCCEGGIRFEGNMSARENSSECVIDASTFFAVVPTLFYSVLASHSHGVLAARFCPFGLSF